MTVESMHRWWLATAGVLVLLSGCATRPLPPDILEKQAELLSGESLFGEPVSSGELADVYILETTEAMRAFLDEQIGEARIPAVKFRRMFRGLSQQGYFTSSYQADTTRTAAETFHNKSGNCLSYTNMFIALAREAGLDARYQIVQVPPSWDADSGYLIRYTHINVLVKGFMYDSSYGQDFSVDFNDVLPDPDYPRYEISDAEATSLYYANRSISLLRRGEDRGAFLYLKKAIEITPDNPDLWINLGAFYAKQEAFRQALGAHQIALAYDPGSRGAMSGISRAHYMLGNYEEAERYAELVRRYREENPFYYYAIAQAEFESANYGEALEAINTAIRLKFRNGRFHFLKGLTQYKLGEPEAARVSFRRAERFGNYRDIKRRYVRDVASTSKAVSTESQSAEFGYP